MKISHLAVAGVLCILGYAYARRIQLPECTAGPGYVHIMWEVTPVEKINKKVASVYRIIGSSGIPPLEKMEYNITPGPIFELFRYPVARCSAAMIAILAAVRVSVIDELPSDENQIRLIILHHQFASLRTVIEATLVNNNLVRVNIPPIDLTRSCEHSIGYIHYMQMHIHRGGVTFKCIKIFGSSNAVPESATLLGGFDLPFTRIQLDSPITLYQVKDCVTANEIIDVLFRKFFHNAAFDLFGEKCYNTQPSDSTLARRFFEAITEYFGVQPTVAESIEPMIVE